MVAVSVDYEANAAAISLRAGTSHETRRVGRSLLADYDADGLLISVEILSLRALLRPEVLADLRRLLGLDVTGGSPSNPARARAGNGVTLDRRVDLVDVFVAQTDRHLVTTGT